jgi:hypothetical protein
MKCTECAFEAPAAKFRYLYNARIDASISMRQCPQCQAWLAVDEMKSEANRIVNPGEAPWGKSSGIEGLAGDLNA